MPAILPLLWANKQLIAEVLGALALAILIWWFTIHNPRVIKDLEQQITVQKREVANAHAAINLLQGIEAEHARIEKESNENINRIRNGKKPPRTGVFLRPGVLPTVYQTYSATR